EYCSSNPRTYRPAPLRPLRSPGLRARSPFNLRWRASLLRTPCTVRRSEPAAAHFRVAGRDRAAPREAGRFRRL
ncbi:MAG: hypothetical protein AVDCRST_MAG83-1235, partial [uncultured Arthrobacter sp.]